MTIEERTHADGKTRPSMTACPYCGTPFGDGETQPHHHLPCEDVPPTAGYEDE